MASDSRFIRLDDFRTLELTGTTNSSGDTSSKFRHGTKQLPIWWLPIEGDVYVPRQGIGPNEIDIRSANASEEFKVLLFFNS